MRELEKKLGYSFKNPALLAEALRHSSYANEHRSADLFSNERLEFLGDSVLGFVTAEFLFRGHPKLPEGDLTRLRAALVCEESLHEAAQELELGKYLQLGNGEEAGGGRFRP
ncbi:MAG: ribonuclease III, partial [Oscillospiraceae bacterium]|nr:ribonuclease III [Oscillospiraceae bacterium]